MATHAAKMGDRRITWDYRMSNATVLAKHCIMWRLHTSGPKDVLVERLNQHKLVHNTAVAASMLCASCKERGVVDVRRAPAAATAAAATAIDVDEADAATEAAGGGGGGPPAASSSSSAAPPRFRLSSDDEDMVRRPQRRAPPARRPRARRCRRALDRAHVRAHAHAR